MEVEEVLARATLIMNSSQNYLSFSFRFLFHLYGVLEELKDICSHSNNSINNHPPKIRNFEMSSIYCDVKTGLQPEAGGLGEGTEVDGVLEARY
jgi:hypothetical protein